MPALDTSPEAESRRLKLRVLAKLMLATAFFTVLFVFASAFLSGDKPGDPTPDLRVDVAELQPGDARSVVWEGRPVIVQRRTAEMIDTLERADPGRDDALRDPDSSRSEQPDNAINPLRSVEREWFVALGLGTDLGCTIEILAADEPPRAPDQPATAAFVDTCRGSFYDGAGRVFAGQYADRNLVVPPHRLADGSLVLGR